MRRLRKILIANSIALFACALILIIGPGGRPPAIWVVPILLTLGLVNTMYWLLPHLVGARMREHGQAYLTLALLLLAGFISWIWIHQ